MRQVLREYQSEGIERLRHAFRTGARAVLYVLPTGGGKTVVFCHITEEAAKRNKRILILVHRRELLLQGSRNLESCGVPHGLIAPGFTQNGHHVQVGSVQTVVRRLDRMHAPDLVILDEGHHATAATWETIVRAFPNARYLGVTATPCRLDGRGLGAVAGGLYDHMVIGPTIQQLTDMGFLSTAMVYAPPSDVDMTGAHVSMGDYQRDEVIAAVDKPKVTGCAVEHYRKFLDGKPAIAFCASVDHSKHVAEQFRQAGYMAQHVDGEMRETDRDLAVKSLGNGSIHVLTACDIISEGVDVPVVMGAILLRPTQSTGLFLQQVGRCLRPLPGKTAVILDHVGNCMRHGLPHDDREWSLDAPRQKRREPGKDDIAIRQCPKCYHVHRTAPQCPQCGFTYPVRKRELAVVKGELRLLTSDQMKQRRRFIAQRIQQGRTKDLDSLIELARARGYNEQWAYHVYQSRMRGKRGE